MGAALFPLLTVSDKLVVRGERTPLPDTIALGLRSPPPRFAICLPPFLSTAQGALSEE